jgi:hypothetical protein
MVPPPPPRLIQGPTHLAAFIADLKTRTDTFTRGRSSTLRLIEHLETTQGAPMPFAGGNEVQKLQAAKSLCASPNDSRLKKYESALRALVRVWGTNNAYAAEVAVVAPTRVSGAWTRQSMKAWIDDVKSQLDQFKPMAVLDAGAYPGDINPDKRAEVQNRARNYKAPSGSVGGTMGDAAWLAVDTNWNPGPAKAAFQRVTADRSGVCSSFAKAASWVLTANRSTGPRIELVSFKNPMKASIAHVFVIVGRKGGLVGGKLTDKTTWGDQTWIVDAWLGAMGWEIVYDVSGFPKPGYLQNLTLLMERKAT